MVAPDGPRQFHQHCSDGLVRGLVAQHGLASGFRVERFQHGRDGREVVNVADKIGVRVRVAGQSGGERLPLAARDFGGTDGLEHPSIHAGTRDGRHHQRNVHDLALQPCHHLLVGNQAPVVVDERLQQGVLANPPLARGLQERHLGVDMRFELLADLLECCDPFIGAEPLHGLVRDQADIQILRETRGQPVVGHQRRAALDGERRALAVESLHGN